MKKLNKDDICYFQFTRGKVHEIVNGRICAFRSYYGGITAGPDLTDECFPDTPKVAEIAELIGTAYDKISELNINGLNMPEIHHRYCRWFVEMCNVRDNEVALEVLGEKVVAFTDEIVQQINNIKTIKVDGIELFR